MDDKLLRIYLNDHLAGATAGQELVRRCLSSNTDTEFEPFLRDLAAAIEEDRTELRSLMSTLGLSTDRLKTGAAWLAEKIGRLKLNGQLTGYSPLSRLEELEGLLLGVAGKLALWRTLKEIADHDSRLAVTDFDKLIARANEQLEALDHYRLRAAAEALT